MNLNRQSEQSIEQVSDNGGQLPSTLQNQISNVLRVEPLVGEEKIITITIPLLSGDTIEVSGTLGEIIKLRKQLELEGKIPSSIGHDEEAQQSLQEVQDRQRWGYGHQEGNVVDYRKIYQDKVQAEKRMNEKIQKNIIQPLLDGKAYITKGTKKTKEAIIEIFIISDKTIDTLSKKDTRVKTGKTVISKDTWIKTGKTLLDIADQSVNTTFPGVMDTLPLVRKQIFMTSKQIIQYFQMHTKKIISKKEEQSKNSDNKPA